MSEVVVIPAHNEERHIGKVIEKVGYYSQNIVVVDDGSNDATSKIAKDSGAIVLRHKINLGKGAALKTGCDYAIQEGFKNIVVIDADGQHDPNEIPCFLSALNDNEIIFSYRRKSETQPLVLKLGNNFINYATRLLYDVNIKDTQCGFRAFTADAYSKIRWETADYFMETEMIIKTGKAGLRYTEIPIETIYTDKYKGTTVIDGVKIVLKMCGWRFSK